MNSIIKKIDKLNKLVITIISILLLIMVIAILAQVIYRFLIKEPLSWTEELGRYIMIWITFLGASVLVRSKGLVAVEAIRNLFPQSLRKLVSWLMTFMSVGFYLIVLYYGIKMVFTISNQYSAAMHIPMSLIYLALPVGALLMVINTVAVILEEKEGEN